MTNVQFAGREEERREERGICLSQVSPATGERFYSRYPVSLPIFQAVPVLSLRKQYQFT